MSVHKIATRYAKALLDLAIEQNQLDEVYNDVQKVNDALKNRDLWLLMKSPDVNCQKKQQITDLLFGNSLGIIMKSYLKLVIGKRREFYLPELVSAFLEQYKIHKGIVSATLTTAFAATDEIIAKVKNLILEKTGKTAVELETKIDPTVIGGFILKFNNLLYDTSIFNRYDQLKLVFSDTTYVKQY